MSTLSNIKSPFKELGSSQLAHGQGRRKKLRCELYGVIKRLKGLTLKKLGLKRWD